MSADLNYYIQAIIGVLVITDPITRGFFFKTLTEDEPERRREYAFKIATAVAIILGISAVAGREILDALGINLGAFGVAGGLVVTLMGFEMLFGGEPSRAQGGEEAHEAPDPKSFEGQVLVPYAMPFVAGPGAITLVITIASGTSDASGAIAALVAVAIAVILLPIGHLLISQKLSLSDNAMKIATKMGGLLIATIGIQLMLSGIQTFFTG
ncbi:MAG: MarC family protein [Solirubrobacterales bacterium]|nr:MarC family protein [Solirubrobacterales bacterium]